MNQPIADFTYFQNTTWRLKAKYPYMRVKTIGKSVVGRSIFALELGREAAPAVLFAGTFLGTDDISGPLLLRFMENLLQSVMQNHKISGVDPLVMLRDRKITVIPFVNPDGREICARGAHCGGLDSGRVRRLSGGNTETWDANARGVDITHNFDFYFDRRRERERSRGVYGPSPRGYGGPSPESEPETTALADYCRRQKLLHTLSFYPGKGEIFWRNNHSDPHKGEQTGNLLALCAGYDLEASIGKITDTGFRNWVAKQKNCPAIDVMLRYYKDPRLFRDLYPVLEEMLTAACIV